MLGQVLSQGSSIGASGLAALPGAVPEGSLKVWAYVIFLGLVVIFLALDLGVFHRHAHVVSLKEAAAWSVVWVTMGLGFSAFVYFAYAGQWLGLGLDTPMYNTTGEGPTIIRGTVDAGDALKQYLTGYVVEKSLALDNIFVIALIFGAFAVPAKYQHRVLFWGILGALVMRGGMILLGAELILRATWILIVFGFFLIFTALKMALIRHESDPTNSPAVRLARKLLPVRPFYDGQRFFTTRTEAPTYSPDPVTGEMKADPPRPGSLGKRAMTPLLLALVMVELADLVFAVDSIPAIFAITPDPFIVFTSNIFAVLGLRSLYFCLAAMISKFRYLKPALILILAFVGVKLLLLALPPYFDDLGGLVGLSLAEGKGVKVDTTLSLLVIVGLLGGAVVASVLRPAKAKEA
jgi:tellurite resistance protein TerC